MPHGVCSLCRLVSQGIAVPSSGWMVRGSRPYLSHPGHRTSGLQVLWVMYQLSNKELAAMRAENKRRIEALEAKAKLMSNLLKDVLKLPEADSGDSKEQLVALVYEN